MNRTPRARLYFLCLSIAVAVASTACQKPKPQEQILPSEHVAPPPVNSTQNVLHKTFSLKTSAVFPFDVPSHAATPHLHGNYKSAIGQLSAQPSDDAANVDFMILTEDQYADFTHDNVSETVFTAPASHDQDVTLGLPPTINVPRKYYFVFRNPSGGTAKKLVQADFTLDF